jgi:hypothetical protein
MSLQKTSLLVQMAPLPATFTGTPQELSAEMVARMRIVSPSGSNFIFVGDTEPTSNVGPWLKDGSKWYVWDETISRYVPQDISDSATTWFHVGNSTPLTSDPPIWLKTTNDATQASPSYGNPISWYVFNGTVWVPYVGIVMSGPTVSRPGVPDAFQLYYDTDISVLIWWERTAWRTVDGAPGDCKFVVWETLAEALTQNPGWEVLGASNVAWRGRWISQATKDAGATPAVDLAVPSGVAKRAARATFGETDGVQMDATSTVPYPPTIALWCLVKV